MKKRILAIALVLICLSVLSASTVAYFTVEDTARNVITTGGIDVQIVEQQLVNGVLQDYPAQAIRIMPDTTVSKIVTFRSVKQDAWIRANYTVTVHDPDGKEMTIPEEELEKVIVIRPDSSKWELKDGWWYCKESVNTGKSSAPLFDEVYFSGPDMDNKYQRCTVTIDITTQAVQKANNGTKFTDAVGWPEA